MSASARLAETPEQTERFIDLDGDCYLHIVFHVGQYRDEESVGVWFAFDGNPSLQVPESNPLFAAVIARAGAAV